MAKLLTPTMRTILITAGLALVPEALSPGGVQRLATMASVGLAALLVFVGFNATFFAQF